MYLRLDAQRKILAHGYRGFEVLLALLAHKLSPKMRWPECGEKVTKMLHFKICIFFLILTLIFSLVGNKCINKPCSLSSLCCDVFFPGNGVWCWSCERLPSDRLDTGQNGSAVLSSFVTSQQRLNHHTSLSHLKVVFADAASFTQALHDGFVPQDVLLAEVFPTFAGLEHQAVDRVEVSQEVSHPFLHGKHTG